MDTVGKVGDIWEFGIYSKTRKLNYSDTFLLVEYINSQPSPYPNSPLPQHNWIALNLTHGGYEDLIIDYDPAYWNKIG